MLMDTRPNQLDIQFEQLPTPTNNFRGFSIEAINLLIELEQNRRLKTQEKPFNCYVYELKQMADSSFDASDLQEAILRFARNVNVDKEPARLQLIIKNIGHYTGIDIQIASTGNRCLVLDAASDLRMFIILNRLEELTQENGKPLFKKIYLPIYDTPEMRMQMDIMSCPIFAFDHVCQSSKLDVFSELKSLRLSGKSSTLSWMLMPPELVWNAQSVLFLETYRENNAAKYFSDGSARGQAFDQYLIAGQQLILQPLTTGYKFQNHAIQRLLESYRDMYLVYRQVNLPSRLTQGETRLMHQLLDFESIPLPVKLSRIVHLPIQGNNELIKKMRLALTLDDFKFLAVSPIESDKTGFFVKSKNPYNLKALCVAILKNDEIKIDKIYTGLFGEGHRQLPPTPSASSSNSNK